MPSSYWAQAPVVSRGTYDAFELLGLGTQVIKLLSYSTQQSMEFTHLMNIEMTHIN